MSRFTPRKVVATVGAVALAALVAAPASATEPAPETVSILAALHDGPVVLVAQDVELPLRAYVRGTIAVTDDGRIVLPDGDVIGEYLDPVPSEVTEGVTWPIYSERGDIVGEAVGYDGGALTVVTELRDVGFELGAPHLEEAA